MSTYPDLSSLDINAATDGLLSQIFSVREGERKTWELSIPEPTESIELLDGSWALVWGDGPPVLLAHGFEGRYSQFAKVIEATRNSGFKLVGLEMPGHGRSHALRADPLSFSNAIQAACSEFGAFHTMIGHSQGANAVLHASVKGVVSSRIVLLAPLVSVESHLRRACALVKLSAEGTELFLRKITELVGVPPSDFEGHVMGSTLNMRTLIVHDCRDKEVPISEAETLANEMSLARLHISDGLGHRRLLADLDTVNQVVSLMNET